MEKRRLVWTGKRDRGNIRLVQGRESRSRCAGPESRRVARRCACFQVSSESAWGLERGRDEEEVGIYVLLSAANASKGLLRGGEMWVSTRTSISVGGDLNGDRGCLKYVPHACWISSSTKIQKISDMRQEET